MLTPDDEENEEPRLRALLAQRQSDAAAIRDFFNCSEYFNLEGRNTLLCKVTAEENFLKKFSAPVNPLPLEKKFLETSNLISLSNLVQEIPKHKDVTAVLKTFALNNPYLPVQKLKVDIVADKGASWVKVISRSPKGICSDWVTGNGRDIFEQAEDYRQMACSLKQVALPRIVFIFFAGISDKMASKLERMGVEVRGDRIPQESLMRLPEDCLEELEDTPESMFQDNNTLAKVNLDVSSVFVLISNLTHPGGCEKQLTSKLLTSQAEEEKAVKAREFLLNEIGDREMIICRTAYDAVQNILKTVAGPKEKTRAEQLFKRVQIIEDNVSERASYLEMTERISERCKTIFGTGDSHKALTATANKHCVSSAFTQGVPFDVIIHPSRALSEKKEIDYVGPR